MDILSIIFEQLIKTQIMSSYSSKRPPFRTPLRGLFQVGPYTRPFPGIGGASLSGLFAAREILKRWHRN